jgi:hypothetical protein
MKKPPAGAGGFFGHLNAKAPSVVREGLHDRTTDQVPLDRTPEFRQGSFFSAPHALVAFEAAQDPKKALAFNTAFRGG